MRYLIGLILFVVFAVLCGAIALAYLYPVQAAMGAIFGVLLRLVDSPKVFR